MARKFLGLFSGFLMFGVIAGSAPSTSGQESKTPTEHGGASITGCVQKGVEPNGFILTTKNGLTYELVNDSVNLGEHVGHTVTITGNKVHESEATEQHKEALEKREAGGGKYADFKVDDLKMVSESCNK